jgi:CheY-like chemotaxis protein
MCAGKSVARSATSQFYFADFLVFLAASRCAFRRRAARFRMLSLARLCPIKQTALAFAQCQISGLPFWQKKGVLLIPIQTLFQEADMKILVVEDHADTRHVLTGLLTRWGYDVISADTLKDGLARLDSEPAIDVIVSDIALPDGTGYALVSEARRKGKPLLAIALSGYAYPSDVKVAKLTGFDHHLSKPCDCHYLRTILQDRARWDEHSRRKD